MEDGRWGKSSGIRSEPQAAGAMAGRMAGDGELAFPGLGRRACPKVWRKLQRIAELERKGGQPASRRQWPASRGEGQSGERAC